MKPGRTLIAALLGWLLLGLLCVWWPQALPIWGAYGAALLALASLDAWWLRRAPPLELERELPHTLALRLRSAVKLRVFNRSNRQVTGRVFDGVPAQVDAEELPRAFRLAAHTGQEFVYHVRPLRRGEARFETAHLECRSRLGLWHARRRAGPRQHVRVYPDFARLIGLELRAVQGRAQLLGVRRKRRRGEGMEFHQLRDYQLGDTLRQVDWKATSRRRKLVSREYQEERDQQIVLLLDCGRRMRSLDGELEYFDHCLNAALLLTWIASRQGDAVGLLAFGGADRWLPPRKGRGAMRAVLEASYDLHATLEVADFSQAAQRLAALQRRRALVLLVTNLRDEDESDLGAALAILRKRHLVVVASLREPEVEAMAQLDPRQREEALDVCAAQLYLEQRAQALRRIGGRTRVLDVAPAQLPSALASRYLEIKRAGAL